LLTDFEVEFGTEAAPIVNTATGFAVAASEVNDNCGALTGHLPSALTIKSTVSVLAPEYDLEALELVETAPVPPENVQA
jgi:hypothetical protein